MLLCITVKLSSLFFLSFEVFLVERSHCPNALIVNARSSCQNNNNERVKSFIWLSYWILFLALPYYEDIGKRCHLNDLNINNIFCLKWPCFFHISTSTTWTHWSLVHNSCNGNFRERKCIVTSSCIEKTRWHHLLFRISTFPSQLKTFFAIRDVATDMFL